MRQPQRTFATEFKQEAVHLLETSGKSGIVIAKELGISDTILYRWRKEMRTTVGAAFPGKGHQTELAEEVDLTRFSGEEEEPSGTVRTTRSDHERQTSTNPLRRLQARSRTIGAEQWKKCGKNRERLRAYSET